MSRLVVRGDLFLFFGKDFVASRAHQDFVASVFEVEHGDARLVMPGRPEGRLVRHVSDVGAGQPDGRCGKAFEIDVVRQWDIPSMNLEQADTSLVVRAIHRNMPIESSRAKKGRVQDVGTVSRRHDDDRLALLKAVHLAQDLIERLFTFVVTAAQARCRDAVRPRRFRQ